MKIFVVDDSKTARMFVIRCLDIVGFSGAEYIEAENGKAALEQLKNDPADLVVTDLNMPVMDGSSLLKRVKSSPKLHDIPVIVISSAANPAKNEEMIKNGARAILEKPVSPAALLEVVGDLISKEEGDNEPGWSFT